MKSPSSKLLIPVIFIFLALIMLYISSENKGSQFIFDNIAIIICLIPMLILYIFIRIKEKTGKISEQQILKAKKFSKNIKKRMTVSFICILIAAIIYVVFNWYYSIPLFIIAIIIYIPILKKIYYGNYGDKTDDNEKSA